MKTASAKLAQGNKRSLRSIFQEAHQQFEQGKGIPDEQFWREVEKAREAGRQATSRGKRV